LAVGIPPVWADAWGEDEFGVFASFSVGAVDYRLRWIAPGTFRMGSPDTEAGRWDGEGPQHDVTLTKGYWLAETPCTQALWHAVMGENPSRFVSPLRPVEGVSWDDVHRFLAVLNERVEGLGARLPTEAEWEYACRAGTTTSTYAGELEILATCNAPRLHDIAWYSGNSGVGFDLNDGHDSSGWPEKQFDHDHAGTREVGGKRPNPWGLYDVLGNVFEWCADAAFRPYGHAAVIDPFHAGGPYRVFRGGSWSSRARSVRAAHRRGSEPGYRIVYLGFRLARGQGLRQGAEPERGTESGRGARARGAARRAPDG